MTIGKVIVLALFASFGVSLCQNTDTSSNQNSYSFSEVELGISRPDVIKNETAELLNIYDDSGALITRVHLVTIRVILYTCLTALRFTI